MLEARQVGAVVATVGRPPPVHWVIATDGSASLLLLMLLRRLGGLLLFRGKVCLGPEVECWGEVLVDDKDPRALGAESLTNNAAELWALAEAFLWLRDEFVLTLGDGYTPLALTSQNWQWNVEGGAVEFMFPLGLLASMRLGVDLGKELSQPLSVKSVGGSSHNTLAERNVLPRTILSGFGCCKPNMQTVWGNF